MRARYRGSLIDLNVRAERMGWLPSAPQLEVNPLALAAVGRQAGKEVRDHVGEGLKSGGRGWPARTPTIP